MQISLLLRVHISPGALQGCYKKHTGFFILPSRCVLPDTFAPPYQFDALLGMDFWGMHSLI